MSDSRPRLISVAEACSLDQSKSLALHQRYANEYLASTNKMAGLSRRYVKAEGTCLWDENGDQYLDFFNIFGCVSLGHNHPRIIDALRSCLANKMPLMQKLSPGPLEAALAHNLAALTPEPLDTCYFASSGSEAIEAAIKLTRGYNKRTAILSTQNSYHGLTLGALALTGMSDYQKPFAPMLPGIDHIPFGDLDALSDMLKTEKYAALFLEPIQGFGGIVVPPRDYLKQARELCYQHGTLLVIDEIQTGLGRTGKFLASDHDNIAPDILVLSKSLSGGTVPISVCITSKTLWRRTYGSIKRFLLNSNTFGANGLACLAALATLETIDNDKLIERSSTHGQYFLQELKKLQKRYPVISEIRGRGLMIGIKFDLATWNPIDLLSKGMINLISPKIVTTTISAELLNQHRIIVAPGLSSEYLIRIFPALTIERAEIDQFISSLGKTCESMQSYSEMFIGTLQKFIQKENSVEPA